MMKTFFGILLVLFCLGCSAHHISPAEEAARLNDADWEIVQEPEAAEATRRDR
jgi:hypothetical protein